jgi:hypothetical protein
LGAHASSMTDVLNQLETLSATRRELVQTPRTFVLAVHVLRPYGTLGDELQSGSASVAAQILAHPIPIQGRTESMLSRSPPCGGSVYRCRPFCGRASCFGSRHPPPHANSFQRLRVLTWGWSIRIDENDRESVRKEWPSKRLSLQGQHIAS